METYYLRTYGCQMNELDSEVMAGILDRRGLTRVEDEAEGDLLIYNTCWIRELAARKVMGKLGQLGRKKKRRPVIGVTGCMANAKKQTLFEKVPHINFVLGTNNIHDLDAVLDGIAEGEKHLCRADAHFEHELPYAEASRTEGIKAYVSIIRGCDKKCTYCCVPYTRGPEVSRDPQSIVEECTKLAHQGFKEITLLGQNVNSYNAGNCRFHDLLYQLDAIDGIERIRFLTSHPVDITRNLMEAIRDLPSLCEFVHFPIQAGSSRILKKMHRIYTKEEYFEKVAMLREIVPNVSLGTDIIVGFPTETDKEFEETVEAMREIRYSVAFIYTYSPRKGTPAIRWRDDVPEEVKADRHHRLLRLHNQLCVEERQGLIGTEVEVLVDRSSAKSDGFMRGRTRCWKKVIFPGTDEMVGSLQKVQVTSYSHETLVGIVRQPEKNLLQIGA